MCAVAVRAHPGWCFWGSRCAGICPTRSAQLLSPHYPLWTRTDIISFSVSLSPHLPPPSPSCTIYHPCLFLSFCLPESTSISVLSLFPLSTRSPPPPPLDWLSLWWRPLGDTACRTWFCGSGLLTATGSRRQLWQAWGSQSGKESIFIRPSISPWRMILALSPLAVYLSPPSVPLSHLWGGLLLSS